MIDTNEYRQRTWLLVILMIVAAVVAYIPSFWGEFIFDDVYYIKENDALHSMSKVWSIMLQSNRPVVIASIGLNYAIGELNHTGYHAFNLLVHLSAGLMLFAIVAQTLRLPRFADKYSRSAEWFAFAIALIWLVHPLQTQSVTYIIQRCESMMGLFYLLTMYCLMRGARADRSWPWYVAGVMSMWLGMGCKEVMATAVVVMPLYDRVFLASSWKEVWRRRWGFYLGFVPALAWMIYHMMHIPEGAGAGFGVKGITPLVYLCSQPNVLLHYLRLALLPDKLCLDYGWKPVESWWQFVPAGLLITGLLVTCLVAVFRHRSPIGFVGLAFFLILAPTSSLMPIADLAFEHRMYLPLACVISLLVFAAAHLVSRLSLTDRGRVTAYATAVTLIVSVLIVRTFVRNRLYTVPLALWSNVLAQNPDNVRGHINYGHHMAKNGHWKEAIWHHRRALELAPDDVGAHDNLARMLAYQGDREGALEHFNRVRELRPQWGSPYYHIGQLQLGAGEIDKALANLHKANEIRSDHAHCHYHLGAAYSAKGDYKRAIKYLESARSAQTDAKKLRMTLVELGETLSLAGNIQAAEDCFEEALNLYRRSADTYTRYGEHFARHNENKLAAVAYQKALECLPDYEPAKRKLAELEQQSEEAAPSKVQTTANEPAGVEAAALTSPAPETL